MRHIYVLILLVVSLLSGGSVTAQTGLKVSNLPALIGDSIVGISIPQMDYINLMRNRYDAVAEDAKFFFKKLNVAMDDIERCHRAADAQNETINAMDRELKRAKFNQTAYLIKINELDRQVKKEQRKKNLAWLTGGIAAAVLTTILIVK